MNTCRDGSPCLIDGEECGARDVPGLCRLARSDARYRGLIGRIRPGLTNQSIPAPRSGPVKVGFFCPVFSGAGGTESWHDAMLTHLDPGRVEIVGMAVLDSSHDRPGMAPKWRAKGLVKYGPDALITLAARCEVIVCWGIANPGDYLPWERRPKLVFVSHGDANSEWSVSTLAAAEPAVDRFVAVAQAAIGPIPEHRRSEAPIIPNGIDRSRLVPSPSARDRLRSEWGCSPGDRLLGFLGRLSYEKVPGLLAKTVAALPSHWRGVLVGDGAMWADCADDIAKLTPGRVVMAGARSDVGNVLAAIDVLLVPSEQEGFGYSIVEAWAAGVPVVVCPVGVALERPTLSWGISANPSGEDAARAVLAIEADPVTMREKCRAARNVAREEYDARLMACRWSSLLEDLSGRERNPSRCPDA